MEKLRQAIDAARLAFSRLTQREQTMVVGGSAAAAMIILIGIGLLVSSLINKEQHRVEVKTQQLAQVLALQGEYKARQQERAARLRTLGSSNVRLISLVEDAAKQAGVEIGQLRPEDGEPGPDGVVESRVDLRASGLSADRLQDFLNRIEAGAGIVIVRHLKLTRPYRKDTAEIELTVSTFKLKAS
jgi:hypothetical protein